jgi:hypothetical protein
VAEFGGGRSGMSVRREARETR